MAEREAFAPRQTYAEGVYSSTKWPANQQMCMHHELSYTLQFPGTMMFACLTAPTEGGATAVADSPTVLNSLPAAAGRPVRAGRLDAHPHATARRSGRTGPRRSAPTTAAAVERYCRANGIEFAWQPDGGLRTRQRRSAIVRHPVTGQPLLVQPDRLPQPVDAGRGRARVPGRGVRRGRAAVQHPLRQRRPDRQGHRGAAQRDQRGQHGPRAVAGRRPAAGGQHPHRAQPRGLHRAARGAGRDGRPGRPGRLLADEVRR